MQPIHTQIFAASMGFMALLTFTTAMVMFVRRMKALKSNRVRPGQFKTYETEHEMPSPLVQASRHFKNLHEMPTLFYPIVLFGLFAEVGDGVSSSLCVGFCFFRGAHSYIHLGSNKLIPRMCLFGASFLALAFLWVYVLGKFFLVGQ